MGDSHSTQTGIAPGQYRVGSTITLHHDLQLLRAASVTVDVLSPTTTTPLVTGATATLPAESVALTSESGRGSKILTVTDDTALGDFQSGRAYLLDGVSFPAQMIDVVDVNSTSSPYTAQMATQLATAAPIGTLLLGTIVTYDATALAMARGRGYRVRWTVTATDGTITELVDSFDVVYQPFELSITRQDIQGAWPGVSLSLDDDWRVLVSGALEAVQGELDAQGLEPDRVRNTRPWKQTAVYYICRAIAGGKAGSDRGWEKAWERFDTLYARSVAQAMNSARVWYDAQDEDERAEADERPPAHWWAARYSPTTGLLIGVDE